MDKYVNEGNCLQSTIKEFIESEINMQTLLGVLIHGSSLKYQNPKDVDLIFLHTKTGRQYRIIKIENIDVEIEYVTQNQLKMYMDNYYWWPHNWEFEIGKYVRGKILFDSEGFLSHFIKILSEYPIDIQRYLFIHRIGMCVDLLSKCKREYNTNVSSSLPKSLLTTNIILAILSLNKIYPSSLNLTDDLPKKYISKYRELISSKDLDIVKSIINEIVIDSVSLWETNKTNNYIELLRYPSDVVGLRYIYNTLNYIIEIPPDFFLSNFGGEKNV